VAAFAGLALAVPGNPAQADDRTDTGDGRRACSVGEICFQFVWDNFTTSTWQRHFWWNDGNHNDNYWHITDPSPTTFSIRDGIGGVYNRDTECAVWLKDIRSGSWVYYSVTVRNTKQRVSSLNNAHERC
jgi:hypothetical protein